MSFLDTALDCIRRGWYVFPCVPQDKVPVKGCAGYLDASSDEAVIRAWWSATPNANVGIAPGKSGMTVLDVDHGLRDEAHLREFLAAHDIPETFAVRTGRRPEFAVQLYYSEPIPSIGGWDLGDCQGDTRGLKGHVMAAGSIHPDSKERYQLLWDKPILPVPNRVRALKAKRAEHVQDDGGPITEFRNVRMISELGRARAAGLSDNLIRARALELNERMEPPLDEEELERLISNACAFPIPEPEPIAVIGGMPEPPKDWRTRYVTFEQVRDAKPTSFFIEGFLALDSITALAAPVGQRKSLIALNVAHALCTGEPLFDYFKVSRQPERVVYLCPEMGLSSFSTRLKSIGLLDYVGKTLFCQTMDDECISLTELNEELPGSVVIIDTLTRFVEGDQNSSEHMSKFAKEVFRLKRAGATVLLLHHSVKGTGNSVALTLDSAMRGSTELAAFVTSCWATRLTDPEQPYASPSLLANVKQRDFESKPFSATSDKSCRMHIVGEPGTVAEMKSKADADAEKILAALLKDSPKLGINKIQEALKAAGHGKGVKWVKAKRTELMSAGVTLTSD